MAVAFMGVRWLPAYSSEQPRMHDFVVMTDSPACRHMCLNQSVKDPSDQLQSRFWDAGHPGTSIGRMTGLAMVTFDSGTACRCQQLLFQNPRKMTWQALQQTRPKTLILSGSPATAHLVPATRASLTPALSCNVWQSERACLIRNSHTHFC